MATLPNEVPDLEEPSTPKVHEPSRPCPIYTPRQKRMLEAFRSPGKYFSLAMEMYKMAEEDLEKFLFDTRRMRSNQKRRLLPIKKSCEDMIKDREGSQEWLKLLHTIHEEAVEAIILNNIGWLWHNDPDRFQKLFLKMDDCSGVYIITWLVEGENLSLNKDEWKVLQTKIRRYIGGKGKYVSKNSSQDLKDAAQEAAEIEKFVRPEEPFDDILKDTMKGNRYLFYEHAAQFCDQLELRMVGDNHRHIQSPLQVGCGKTLQGRTASHDPTGSMSGSSKTLALTWNCLKIMGVRPYDIAIPIIKVWDYSQMEIAEIGVTMLGGSLANEFGHNMKQAGAQEVRNGEENFEKALEQIATEATWTEENFNATDDYIARLENAGSVTKSKEQLEKDSQQLNKQISDSAEITPQLNTSIALESLALWPSIAVGKALLGEVDAALEVANNDLRFMKELTNWLVGGTTEVERGLD